MLLACFACFTWAQESFDSNKYYRAANGKSGAELKTAMHQIIGNPSVVSYSGLKAAYVKTDTRPDGFLRDWYSNATSYVPGSAFGSSIKAEGDGYNREHLFPQSWFDKVSPMVSDIVHVVPTDGYTNSRRNDLPMGEVVDDAARVKTSANGYSKWGAPRADLGVPEEVTTVFEPNDEIKGDIARIYFYMSTCYQDQILTWTGNNAATVIGGTEYEPLLPWVMEMMMRWSAIDPVDSVEIARNDSCYAVQSNRNPFVDYPGLEDYIWGNKVDEPFVCAEGTDDPDDEAPQSSTIMLNNQFFGVDWTGARPTGGATQMTGRQDGITVTYAKGGSGQNMYCNDSQIRLYKYNELTFSVTQNTMQKIEFNVVANTSNKTLYASVGNVDGFTWTGDATKVVFTVDTGNGNVQIDRATVTIPDVATYMESIDDTIVTAPVDDAVYTLSGVRVNADNLRPGIYIRGGKKFVVR